MIPAELPDGWASTLLGDGAVSSMQPGFACGAHNRSTGVPHLRPMNVSEDGRIALGDVKFVPHSEVDREERWLGSGDVLFNNTNSPELVGKTAFYGEAEPRAFSNHMTRLRCRDEVLDPRFCALYLHQLWREGYFEAICNNHVSQASIGRTVLMETEIPLPPLREQRRIVEKIERLLARVNVARDHLARVPAILGHFRQSVLAAACSGRLTEDWRGPRTFDWKSVALSEVVQNLDQGWSPKCDVEPSSSEEVWGIIKTTAVQPLRFDDRENKRLPRALNARPELEIRSGDLIITRAGPRVRAGVTCLVRRVRPRLMICDKVYRFRARAGVAIPEFVNLCLNAPEALDAIEAMKTGISDSGVNLTQGKFLDLRLDLPPLDEQREIVRCAEALLRFSDTIEAGTGSASARADMLARSIVAKAFRGELVPTEAELAREEGRDYETADELMARIERERGTAKAGSVTGGYRVRRVRRGRE